MERSFETWLDSTPLSPHRDLSGLAVHDADDLLAGYVYGVLSETDVGVIRYLDVELADERRHVLVPIGHARVEAPLGSPRLRLRAARLQDLRKIPSYHDGEDWRSADTARELAGLYGRFFRGDHYYAHPAFEHHGWYAGPHPIVLENGAAPEGTLFSSPGSDAVRGRQVLDSEGVPAGVVSDHLVEWTSKALRYLVIELPDGGRRLMPVGYLESAGDALRLPGLTLADLQALPDFAGQLPTREEEERILKQIERALDARNPFLRVDYSDRQVLPE